MSNTSPAALEGRKHTPVPWKTFDGTTIIAPDVEAHRPFSGHRIAALNGWPNFSDETQRANAAFIVEACNSHALLLAQNAEMREALEQSTNHLSALLAISRSRLESGTVASLTATLAANRAALSRNGGKV